MFFSQKLFTDFSIVVMLSVHYAVKIIESIFSIIPYSSVLIKIMAQWYLTDIPCTAINLFHVVPYGPTYERRLIELPTGTQFEGYLQKLGSWELNYDKE